MENEQKRARNLLATKSNQGGMEREDVTRKTEWHVGLGRVFWLWCTALLTKNVWHHDVVQP